MRRRTRPQMSFVTSCRPLSATRSLAARTKRVPAAVDVREEAPNSQKVNLFLHSSGLGICVHLDVVCWKITAGISLLAIPPGLVDGADQFDVIPRLEGQLSRGRGDVLPERSGCASLGSRR